MNNEDKKISKSINVETKGIVNSLIDFKKEMLKLDNISEEIKQKTNEIKKSWEGNASDETLSEIDKFQDIFNEIKKKDERYINFINSVIEKYTDEDETNIKNINSNMDYYDVDGI